MSAPDDVDPYAPPASLLAASEEQRDLRRGPLYADRALLLILLVTVLEDVRMASMLLYLELAPGSVLTLLALPLGLKLATLLLVWTRSQVGYLLSMTVGSLLMTEVVSAYSSGQDWLAMLLAFASVALWVLPWYVARARYGYMFKAPRYGGPSLSARPDPSKRPSRPSV